MNVPVQKKAAELKSYQTSIGGKWVDAASGKFFQTFDPYTGEPWALIPECDKADVDRAVEAAAKAFLVRTVAADDADRARPDHAQDRAFHRAARRASRARRSARQRQADFRNVGADAIHAEWFYYFGGLADKIEGAVCRSTSPITSTTSCASLSASAP